MSKHTFTIEAEYSNGMDGKVQVEILDDGNGFDQPLGEGYADTLSEAVALAFKDLELPTTR